MLSVNELIGFGVGGPGRQALLTEPSLVHTTNASSITFASANIGAADGSRVIIVNAVSTRSVTGSATVTCSVNGVSATERHSFIAGAKFHNIFTAVVPNGTVGDVVLTYSVGLYQAAVSIIAAYGGLVETPYSTDTNSTTSSSLTLNIPSNGILVCSHNSNSANDAVWANATERVSTTISGTEASTSVDLAMPAETSRVISITQTATAESAAGASFGWS